MHYLSKLFLSSWMLGFLGSLATHNIVFPAAIYSLIRFGPVYKYFDWEREMEDQIHIHISAFSLLWLGSFVSIPLILFTKRKPLIQVNDEKIEIMFFYITILFIWFTTDFLFIVQNTTNNNLIFVSWIKNILIFLTVAFIIIQLWYNSRSRKNILWFITILFHSLYIHFIKEEYIHLVFLTPFIYAICLTKFSNLEFKIILLSSVTIFIYNIIFFLNKEERYKYVYILSIIASAVVMSLFTIFLHFHVKDLKSLKINK